MPGHGVSTWRDGLDLDGIAEDIALWIAEHGARPATIVSHSQGGMIAMRIAARYPDVVRRLVLVNTSARAEFSDRIGAWQKRRAALLDANARDEVLSDVQRMTTAPGWMDAHPGAAAREREVMASHDPVRLASALDAAVLNRTDIRPLLAGITSPVDVVSGALDQATPPELGEEIAASVAHRRHTIVAGAAHHIPTEQPDVLIQLVREG